MNVIRIRVIIRLRIDIHIMLSTPFCSNEKVYIMKKRKEVLWD